MLNPFDHISALFAAAYEWLGKARKNHPPDADIWDFRRMWQYQADNIISRFSDGSYFLGVQKKISLACGDTIAMWSSVDSLVIKVLTGILQQQLQPFLSKRCYHLKGHKGLKGAVLDVITHCPKYNFFCKTDVKSYYASIDHYVLMTRLHDYIKDWRVNRLCYAVFKPNSGMGRAVPGDKKGNTQGVFPVAVAGGVLFKWSGPENGKTGCSVFPVHGWYPDICVHPVEIKKSSTGDESGV